MYKNFGFSLDGKHKAHVFFIVFLYFLASYGFSFAYWNHLGTVFYAFIILIMVLFCVLKIHTFKNLNFVSIVLLLIFMPLLSSINSFAIYGQSIISSVRGLFTTSFVWILYFVLHYLKVKEGSILSALFYMGIFIVMVQIIQQFTYPNAFFGVLNEEAMQENGALEAAGRRNGILRFRISLIFMPFFFALFVLIKRRINLGLFLIFILLLSSIYLSLTRQIIASALLTLFASFVMEKNKHFFVFVFFIVISFSLVYFFSDDIFGDLIRQTQEEANEDNIRVQAVICYWGESIRSLFTFLLGYGVSQEGAFANHTELLRNLGLCYNDIGFIGMIWHSGIIYVILSYYLLYRLFFSLKNSIPIYVRMYVFYVSLMSIMMFPFGDNSQHTFIWPILLYICDLHINKSPNALKLNSIL